METPELNAFDIGMHYLNLQREDVSDADIGKCIRRFIRGFAEYNKNTPAYEVTLPKNKHFVEESN